MDIIVVGFLVIFGISIIIVKPKLFFIYWLSIYAYILPLIYLPLRSFFTPYERFVPILSNYPGAILFLMLLFSAISWRRPNRIYKIVYTLLFPLTLLLLFIFLQNVIVGIDIRALIANTRDILWSVAPFCLLMLKYNVRPTRDSLINYIIIFVFIQTAFCFLNLVGFRIYGSLNGGFDDNLISGTFPRYNHMADYLTIFFYILSYEYWECNRIKKKLYYLMFFLIGLLIFMSGARMSLILYTLIVMFYIFCYKSRKIVFGFLLGMGLLGGLFIIGNDSYLGKKADDGTGMERNMIGIINLANSDDVSEGNTLEMSARILYDYLNSPLFGNGKSYRQDFYYGKPTWPYNNEGSYKVDARLAFMFVEYGIIGLLLFFFLFFSIFKGCYLYSEENKKKIYIGAFLFFLLNSTTDPGFWDYIMFSVIIIYVFSTKDIEAENKNRNKVKASC